MQLRPVRPFSSVCTPWQCQNVVIVLIRVEQFSFFSIISCFQYLLHLTIAVEFLSGFFFHPANDKRHQRKHFFPIRVHGKTLQDISPLHLYIFFSIFFLFASQTWKTTCARAHMCASAFQLNSFFLIFALFWTYFHICGTYYSNYYYFAAPTSTDIIFFASSSALYFRHQVYVAMARTHVILK